MLRFALILSVVAAGGAGFVACSGGDDSSNPTTPIDYDGAQAPRPGFEAGAACSQANDCVSGLDCLYPTTGCQAFKVCTPPITSCGQTETVCSCLAETIQACNGFATDPIDYLGPCNEAGAQEEDAGVDAPADQVAPPIDAPSDTSDTGAADTSTDSASE